jgi:Lon protease-like protein
MTELPLFALHAVLCPGIALPLHVFEPRYRALIRRCLEDGSPFGIVRIRDGREVGMAQPDLERVGTLAEIREVRRQEDGRLDVMVVGSGRIKIGPTRVAPEGYLIAPVEPVEDLLGDPGRARLLAARVGRRFVRYLELLRPDSGESGSEVEIQIEVDVEGSSDPADVEVPEPEVELEATEAGPDPEGDPELHVGLEAAGDPPGSRSSEARDARLEEVARRLAIPDDPTALSHLLSGIVQVEGARRQMLLEAPTTEARLARLDVLLGREIFFLERRLGAFLFDPRATAARLN